MRRKLSFRFNIISHLIIILTALPLYTLSSSPPIACDVSKYPQTKGFKFCDVKLPIRQRVIDLVSRLSLDEKISQLVNSAPEIERLGIPPYEWWSEALHGVSGYGFGVSFKGKITGATSFPQVILSAATFDSTLWFRIGQAIGKEARAFYNEGQAKGLTFWTPNINIFRDPRWGRGQETPGEDPLVAAKYAAAYVRGIQGDSYYNGEGLQQRPVTKKVVNGGGRGLLASACCKHFTAYDLDNWKGVNRVAFDAHVTAQDLADTYQPPFKSCVEQGRASGIMCAYNRVNGVPNCADYNLLTKTARGQWGFHGYITSDCDAVSIMHDVFKYANSPEDAVADVLKAGMDVNCGSYLKNHTKSAIQQKKLTESQVDRALHNLFSVRMRLGLFQDITKLPFSNLKSDQVCTDQHQQLALEAARNGIVLLKNSNNLLPLSKSGVSSLAVIGPNTNNAYVLRGNYEGQPCKSVEILRAIKSSTYAGETLFHEGCNAVECSAAYVEEAVEIAKRADYVVLVMGLDQSQEKEDHDRVELSLPGQQERLVRAVSEAAKRPVVLVLVCGGPVDVGFAKDDPKIGAILWAGYPGEAGGLALVEILFGDHNPGGKLPVTWYPKDFVNIPMTDMRMRPDPSSGYPGRTYRFYTGPKVFEFGHGLSYTTYSYSFMPSTPNTIHLNQRLLRPSTNTRSSDSIRYLSVPNIGVDNCETLKFSTRVHVENTGDIDGKHPVLLFLKHANKVSGSGNSTKNPVKKLVDFESVSLKAKERVVVEFVLNVCEHLSTANEDGLMVIEEGYRYLVVDDKEYAINIVL